MDFAVTLDLHGIKPPDDEQIHDLIDLLIDRGAVRTGSSGHDRWAITVTVDAPTIDDAVTRAVADVSAAASAAHMPLSNIDALQVLTVDEQQRRSDLGSPGRHRTRHD